MAKIKVAINGFGRIGRNVYKLALEHPELEIIGINDLTDTKTLAHLLKYDSTQGRFKGEVSFDDESIVANGMRTKVTADRSPADIKWAETPDVVIESTGVFREKENPKGGYGDHLKNGAKKVILTVPAKDQIDNMIEYDNISFISQNIGEVQITGTELDYNLHQDNWSLQISAISQSPENKITGKQLLRRAKNSLSALLQYNLNQLPF